MTASRNKILFEQLELIVDPQHRSASINMAIDEILLQNISAPILRFYSWVRPAVSFGYFEKYNVVKSDYPNRELVRRWTGGGVVLHENDRTYSLLVPSTSFFTKMKAGDSYLAIHQRIAHIMRQGGLTVSTTDCCDDKTSNACFENAVRHDILLGNKKVGGGAQRRTKFGLLHQGSIQNVLLPLNFIRDLAGSFSLSITERKLSPLELNQATALAEAKYAGDAWMQKF